MTLVSHTNRKTILCKCCHGEIFNIYHEGTRLCWFQFFPDFATPLDLGGARSSKSFVPSEDGVAMIMAMGFSRDQAVKALKNTVCYVLLIVILFSAGVILLAIVYIFLNISCF